MAVTSTLAGEKKTSKIAFLRRTQMGRLDGKTAVVLGAAGAGNMGQVIARRFAAEGARVLVAGRRAEELNRLALAWHGALDVAVNATGWGLLKPFLDTTEDELRQMADLQFKGPFLWLQAMVGAMREAGRGGSLIQISSATATIMLNDHAAYMGAKAGSDHVMRCVANEFGAEAIRANSISPGLTATPMTAQAQTTPGVFEAFLPSYPLGRVGTSEDIAAACVWLGSDECFMTGQNLQVNGGLTLRRNPTREEIVTSVTAALARSGN
jgi:NAD(P)-dependent dehydrogenase (short-subunit alcohol dehydrogenase family)